MNLLELISELFNKGVTTIFKRSTVVIKFSDDDVVKIAELMDTIGDILIKTGHGYMLDHLSKIRLAAENRNSHLFKKYVLSNELFGGAGSLRDVYINDKESKITFAKLFIEFIDLTKALGISNPQIDKTRSDLYHLVNSNK